MPEPIVTLNEESLKTDLRELVRKTVEDTLNGLLEEEADDLVGAERYERTAEANPVQAARMAQLIANFDEAAAHPNDADLARLRARVQAAPSA